MPGKSYSEKQGNGVQEKRSLQLKKKKKTPVVLRLTRGRGIIQRPRGQKLRGEGNQKSPFFLGFSAQTPQKKRVKHGKIDGPIFMGGKTTPSYYEKENTYLPFGGRKKNPFFDPFSEGNLSCFKEMILHKEQFEEFLLLKWSGPREGGAG